MNQNASKAPNQVEQLILGSKFLNTRPNIPMSDEELSRLKEVEEDEQKYPRLTIDLCTILGLG